MIHESVRNNFRHAFFFSSVMKKQLLLLLTITLFLPAFACQCPVIENLKEEQQASFADCDVVFIGKVISVGKSMKYQSEGHFDNRIYEIEVIEGFKGTEVGEILKGYALTTCSASPDNGTWIIYASKDDECNIYYSSCSLSRSFHEPDRIMYPDYIPPPPPSMEQQVEDVLAATSLMAKIRLKAVEDLQEEIEWLRSKK